MCVMLNVFVPVPDAAVGPPVRGLHLLSFGEIQRDFAARFAAAHGTLLAAHGGRTCLCGFDDWPALYEIARELLGRNAVSYVALLHFWSSERYQLVERAVDLEDAEQRTAIATGEVVIASIEPARRRRHRQVVRTLRRRIGAVVSLTLRSGRTLRGVLVEFDPESEVGRVGDQTFVAGQVHEVAE
jgi:hypothetical protein